MAMSENSVKVLNYLKDVKATANSTNVIAADVAEALGLAKTTVDSCFTSALQRKGLGYREEAEIKVTEGDKTFHKQVKFLKLTAEGMKFDPAAVEE